MFVFVMQIILTVWICLVVLKGIIRDAGNEDYWCEQARAAGCIIGILLRTVLNFFTLCFIWNWFGWWY